MSGFPAIGLPPKAGNAVTKLDVMHISSSRILLWILADMAMGHDLGSPSTMGLDNKKKGSALRAKQEL